MAIQRAKVLVVEFPLFGLLKVKKKRKNRIYIYIHMETMLQVCFGKELDALPRKHTSILRRKIEYLLKRRGIFRHCGTMVFLRSSNFHIIDILDNDGLFFRL